MSLLDQINESIYAVEGAAAIEMTPQAHAGLILEVLENTSRMEMGMKFIAGLPIIFVHGDGVYFKILNNEQFVLRKKHTDYLKLYKDKYKTLTNIINNSHKVNNIESMRMIYERELSYLVKVLNDLEEKMKQVTPSI